MQNFPGNPVAWYAAALFLWVTVTVFGIAQRKNSTPFFPIAVGTGSALLLAAAVFGGNNSATLPMPFFLASSPLQFTADPLSRWFLAIIATIGIVTAVFSPSYLEHLRKNAEIGFIWAALSLLMISMSLVVLASNAIVFLVVWELMALSSFALVASNHQQHSVQRAALIYLGATRTGTAFLMAGFLWAHHLTGTWNFASWHITGSSAIGPGLMIFIGLAVKAGSWPFHLWLPIAHPAAPAPVSAVMSGVMIKTAIYAMIRLLISGHIECPYLGPTMLFLGAISAFWGVFFALLQQDLKKLLAYSSVENIGIVLMGLGLSATGNQFNLPILAQIGLVAALFHLLNHALFKSLLFFGAGVVDARAHTRDIELLGGLIHKMPITAACFIIGCASICAFPPLNGFASEWLLYKGFFTLAQSGISANGRLCGLLLMGWLALIGALALACFVKAVGVAFLGLPRSSQAAKAKEGSHAMIISQIALAALCALMGIGASLVAVPLSKVAASIMKCSPATPQSYTLPIPAIALALLLVLGALAIWMRSLSGARKSRRFITWECGFGDLSPRTQYTASSFMQPIARMFRAVNHYSVEVEVQGPGKKSFPDMVSATSDYEPYLQTRLYTPALKMIHNTAEALLARLQAGSIHQYLVYMMAALVLLLFLGYRS